MGGGRIDLKPGDIRTPGTRDTETPPRGVCHVPDVPTGTSFLGTRVPRACPACPDRPISMGYINSMSRSCPTHVPVRARLSDHRKSRINKRDICPCPQMTITGY
jgi:hypothetical protein